MRRCNADRRKRKNAHTTINYRSLKNFDQKKLKEDLAQAPWYIIESFDNPSDALDTWYNIDNSIIDLHVPRRVKRAKPLMLPKWMDKSILASIRTRDRLKKSVTNAASWLEYKTYRNKVTFQIRKAKKRFYANLIEENKGDSKLLWKVLRSPSNSWAKGSLPTSINDNSRYVTETHEIPAMFNLHFSSIADTVFADHEAGIQHQDQKHHNEEILETVNRFVHQPARTGVPPLSSPPVPEDFLSQQIERLSTNKAKGIDSLNDS